MLWRLPWIIGKSPLSISVYLYVWYVRQSSSVDSPLASPWRQSSKIFHSDNKRRLYSAFLFSNVDTTATHTHDWILSQGPENIPSWNWAIYERPFFHHLNCHPHSINSSFRRQQLGWRRQTSTSRRHWGWPPSRWTASSTPLCWSVLPILLSFASSVFGSST